MSTLGNTEGVEFQKLHLEATRKRNKLLDLEIETKKVLLEMQKVQLKQLGG